MLQTAFTGLWNALGTYTTSLTPRLSSNSGAADGIHVLPLELVAAILRFLPQDDIRQAAGVSRDFRAAARQAGLFIPLNLRWTTATRPPARQWDTLQDVMLYASQHNCRVGLDFEFSAVQSSGELSILMLEAFRAIMIVIRDGLPWLVRLALSTSDAFFPDVYNALKSRAPHLHTFILKRIPSGDSGGAPHLPVPADLFAGIAPNLCTVYLISAHLHPPVPAFSLARDVCLSFGCPWPVLPIKLHFPRVSCLSICYTEEQETPLPKFDFSGLVLRELTIVDNLFCPMVAHIETSLPLRDIPLVEHYCDRIKWGEEESIWRDTEGPFSARLQYSEARGDRLTVIVIPAHKRWRRIFHIDSALSDIHRCPLMGMDGVYEHLAYLRLDNRCIAGFLHFPFRLSALHHLHIDFVRGHADSTLLYPPGVDQHVSCPVLREVSLLALDSNSPIAVKAAEVAYLGRALGQLDRRRKDRARLILRGVTLAKPVQFSRFSQAQLDYDLEVFYSIKHIRLSEHPSRKVQLSDFFWDY